MTNNAPGMPMFQIPAQNPLPAFQVPQQFNQQMSVQANAGLQNVMNVVLGSVVNNMWSSFQQAQQTSVYTSAHTFLSNVGLKTCAHVDTRLGIKCTETKLVRDQKTGQMSDFCQRHKYNNEKKRELQELRELRQQFAGRKRKTIEIDSDEDDGEDLEDFIDDSDNIQPWSNRPLPEKYQLKNKNKRSRRDSTHKKSRSSKPASTPETAPTAQGPGEQPQPQNPPLSPNSQQLVNGLNAMNLDKDVDSEKRKSNGS